MTLKEEILREKCKGALPFWGYSISLLSLFFGRKNWYLFMDENKQIFPTFDLDKVTYGVLYFESKEKAQEAIESVGAERVKKYIFGLED